MKKTRAPTEKKKTTRAPSKPKIKESLIKQLEAKNANVAHFQDLIYDYLQLYDTKKCCKKISKHVEFRTKHCQHRVFLS